MSNSRTSYRAASDKKASGKPSAAVAGADDFLNQAFVRRFLASYLNYSPSNVDDRWANSLNMIFGTESDAGPMEFRREK